MSKLHLFLSIVGGIYLVLLIADRFMAGRRKKNNKNMALINIFSIKLSFLSIQLLINQIALAAGVVYFVVSLFSKSIGLVAIGFFMIVYSSGMVKILKE
jgi:hypothetical protein